MLQSKIRFEYQQKEDFEEWKKQIAARKAELKKEKGLLRKAGNLFFVKDKKPKAAGFVPEQVVRLVLTVALDLRHRLEIPHS